MKIFVLDQSGHVTFCFPEGLDTSGFIEVTCVGDSFKKFLDPSTGDVHDCRDHYNDLMGIVNQEMNK